MKMSLQPKTAAQAMEYEQTGNKTTSKGNGKRLAIKTAEQLSTSRLLWIVTKRHKTGLLAVGNIVLVLNWAFPAWTELVKSLF